MTIDETILFLTNAKLILSGDAMLVLSLSNSGIEDADVDAMVIKHEGESRYIEVRVNHPSLQENA